MDPQSPIEPINLIDKAHKEKTAKIKEELVEIDARLVEIALVKTLPTIEKRRSDLRKWLNESTNEKNTKLCQKLINELEDKEKQMDFLMYEKERFENMLSECEWIGESKEEMIIETKKKLQAIEQEIENLKLKLTEEPLRERRTEIMKKFGIVELKPDTQGLTGENEETLDDRTEIITGEEAGSLMESMHRYELASGDTLIAGTYRGINYKDHNEDRIVVVPSKNMVAVVDGMGGYENGAAAADILANELLLWPNNARLAAEKTEEKIRTNKLGEAGAVFISTYIFTKNKPDGQIGKFLAISQLGDAKLAVIGKDGTIKFTSKDQSYVQDLVDVDKITTDEALYHPQRNMITYAVMAGETEEPKNYAGVGVDEGDLVLLMSDGVSDNFTPEEMAREKKRKGLTANQLFAWLSMETDNRMKNAKEIKENSNRERDGIYSDGYKSEPKADNQALAIIEIKELETQKTTSQKSEPVSSASKNTMPIPKDARPPSLQFNLSDKNPRNKISKKKEKQEARRRKKENADRVRREAKEEVEKERILKKTEARRTRKFEKRKLSPRVKKVILVGTAILTFAIGSLIRYEYDKSRAPEKSKIELVERPVTPTIQPEKKEGVRKEAEEQEKKEGVETKKASPTEPIPSSTPKPSEQVKSAPTVNPVKSGTEKQDGKVENELDPNTIRPYKDFLELEKKLLKAEEEKRAEELKRKIEKQIEEKK